MPRGPRPGRVPIMIGANGPRGQRQAVRHADIWSCYIEERAHVDEIRPRIASLESICAEEGREPESIGRSVGMIVDPREPAGANPAVVSGSAEEIADTVRSFHAVGFTQVELMIRTANIQAVEALEPVLALLEDA